MGRQLPVIISQLKDCPQPNAEYVPSERLKLGVSGILCKRGGHQISERRSPNSMVTRVSAAFQS